MTTSPRRTTLSLPVTRSFEFTRLEDQLVARAYQVLIPIVSRSIEGPRPPRSDPKLSMTTFRGLRSQAEGA
jgi:hypothetical protein